MTATACAQLESEDQQTTQRRGRIDAPGHCDMFVDSLGNGSLQSCCASPWAHNYGSSIDPEDYACADKCDYLLDQYPTAGYEHPSAQLCDMELTPSFDDFADASSSTPACSEAFDSDAQDMDDCYNRVLPPAPSIRRSVLGGVKPHWDGRVVDSNTTKPWGVPRSTPGQPLGLPNHRTSTNGRLVTAGDQIGVMYPENLDYGLRTHPDSTRPINGQFTYMPPWLYIDPTSGQSTIARDTMIASTVERNIDLCSTNGPEPDNNPLACRAMVDGSMIDGDCYEQTIVVSAHGLDANSIHHWDLRSIDLVFFVPGGKEVRTAGLMPVRIYPRSAVSDWQALPEYNDYSYTLNVTNGDPNRNNVLRRTNYLVEQYESRCKNGNSEPWCAFIDDQKSVPPSSSFSVRGHAWDRTGFHDALLEPSTTADGRVIVFNGAKGGITYAYNTVGGCDASGWSEIKNLSSAFEDPNVNTQYGFARQQIRDMYGNPFAAGDVIRGGYPWIDRAGNNVLFPSSTTVIDGYKTRWGSDLLDANDNVIRAAGSRTLTDELSTKNSRGVVALGSWTRGKMVLLDGGLNLTDFSGPDTAARNHKFDVQLYLDDGRTDFRPTGISVLSSLESVFTYIDAYSPISPADVVWMVNSAIDHNAEVVFDEYLDPNALVVAHMNSPMRNVGELNDEVNCSEVENGLCGDTIDDNGFVGHTFHNGQWLEDPDATTHFEFVGSPKLQNAATVQSPASLRLLGGAWVPPVAEGGVKGKGIYLDGTNDGIEVTGLPSGEQSYYLGLWVDARSTQQQVIFSFGPDSYVSASQDTIKLVHGGNVNEASTGLAHGQYVHIGVAIYENGVDVYRNGQLVSAFLTNNTPQLPETLWVGKPTYQSAPHRPIAGWVDELRVYRLDPSQRFSLGQLELLCNQALGSLSEDGCTQLDVWAPRETGSDGLDDSLDFPAAAYAPGSCGNSVHRNRDASCLRDEAFGIDDKHVVANVARPDFTSTVFCTSCHVSDTDPTPGLRQWEPLRAGNLPSRIDARRQPMAWPRVLSGTHPTLDGQALLNGSTVGVDDLFLDDLFLGQNQSEGPQRQTP